MFDMLIKSLGLNPDEAKAQFQLAYTKVMDFDNRLAEIEKKQDIILAYLNTLH